MEIALNSRAKQISVLGAAFLVAAAFLLVLSREFAATLLAHDPGRLGLAVRLVPANSEYHELLGHQLLHVQGNVSGAIKEYTAAAALNPHDASYWIALATARQVANDEPGQRYALERAIAADPTTPDIAWQAANFFLSRGDQAMALREFRIVVENEPGLAYAVFGVLSHVADTGTIVEQVLSSHPFSYLLLLDFLRSRNDVPGTVQVWNALVRLGQPIEARRALDYVDFLIAHQEIAAARTVWQQTTQLCGLSQYLHSRDNLVVNPVLEYNILNGGFDWRYRRQRNVELALDPAEFHEGHRSLSIAFDGPGLVDAGISQFIPVDPATKYEVSASYKAEAMEGAGGPRLRIEDAFSGQEFFSSEDLRDSDIWKEITGSFTTGPDTQMLTIRIVRIPERSPIRGKLWVDNFRLAEKNQGS